MKFPGRERRRPKRKVMEPVKEYIKENVMTVEAVYHWEKRKRISPLANFQGKRQKISLILKTHEHEQKR